MHCTYQVTSYGTADAEDFHNADPAIWALSKGGLWTWPATVVYTRIASLPRFPTLGTPVLVALSADLDSLE